MGYRTLSECVADLERHGRLLRVEAEVDPRLEVAEIHRRVQSQGGPALLFTHPRGCEFPLVSNLFGAAERARFMFRDTWESVRRLVELRADPSRGLRDPRRYWRAPWTAWRMLPRRTRRGAVGTHQISLRQLPQVVHWPDDGGPFVTLPLVYSEHPDQPGLMGSNLGMYRVQLAGNDYDPEREVGLHYQIHRGIGVHHAAAQRRRARLPVNVFVGGAPALTLAAVMPLPEGLSELTFAGALAGRRVPMVHDGGLPFYGECDFCLRGEIDPSCTKPEGPFGDHLGYYSLVHPFPVLQVRTVTHRPGAIWPLTVVGRPPQEDSTFGELIHDLTGPMIPQVLPGVREVHAVDAAGVHPLLLAIGSERYTPYEPVRRPQELLTQANAILGQGQMSLAKYLLIVHGGDNPGLRAHDVESYLIHLLRRVDWRCDLHFQTRTTIDTLDYTGRGLNQGSKVVIAAAGPPRRELPRELPAGVRLPDGFDEPRLAIPGVLTVRAPAWRTMQEPRGSDRQAERFCRQTPMGTPLDRFPLVVLTDDSEFAAASLDNLLWTTFTRSDPAADVHGVGAESHDKHWGCRGSLVIDARRKPWHAPPLVPDPEVSRRVDALAAAGGPLAKWL